MTRAEADALTAKRVLIRLPALVARTRAKRGESLRAAAVRMGTTHVHLYRLEQGQVEPKLSTITAMLDYLSNGKE